MIFAAAIFRLAYIIGVICKHTVLLIADLIFLRRKRMLTGPQRLRLILEDVGGTFLKFGQMLALQPDILSLRYCNELFNLLDRVTPFEYAEVERIFVEELGQKPTGIFDHIEREPLATASIGQVHVAYLNGQKLAVKVQRPQVEFDFSGDVRLMNATLRIIKTFRLSFLYWLIEPISEFVAWTVEELDYRFEADYMKRLRGNARDNRNEHIPAVFSRYTTRRTLVTEFLEGVTLLGYLRALESNDEAFIGRLKKIGFEPNAASGNIINNFLGDVFRHGIFHADLHPANLMILPQNVIGYCDFGITGSISPFMRQKLIALTLEYTRGNLEGMSEAFFEISVSANEKSRERFRAGLRKISAGWYEGNGKNARLRKNFTLVMLDMLRLSRSAGVMPERDVVKYIRSAIAIDGLITRFAPGFDLGRHLEKVCNGFMGWNTRHHLLSYGSMLDWAITNGRLMRDSPTRIVEIMDRLTSERNGRETEDSQSEVRQNKILLLGTVIFLMSLLITLTGEQNVFGFNMFTAGLFIIFAAVIQMVLMIQRSALTR